VALEKKYFLVNLPDGGGHEPPDPEPGNININIPEGCALDVNNPEISVLNIELMIK